MTAGVTVIDGLRMVQDQTENKYLREALYRVMVNVEKGDSLADAMGKYATTVNGMTTAKDSDSLDSDLKNKIESYLEKSLADTEAGLSSKNCTGKKFYFQKSDKGFKVFIGESASKAVVDSDGVEFSTTPASK